ncbi:MAG: hypothetical protein M1816_000542 [Peltula sp. TS41687]|nr:MAG: hypothetical protein M1816_000542 [Peltula sp. TS41687]
MADSKQAQHSMRIIAPSSLTSLPARISYLKAFQGFTDEDGALIHEAESLLKPLVPAILDAVYVKLLSYTITAKAFVPRQRGHQGAVPANVHELTPDHPQIAHRKNFLKAYLVRLVGNQDWSDQSRYWEYLDRVGVMHTGEPGFDHRKSRPELRVELVHMGMLLGYVEDLILGAVLSAEGLDLKKKVDVVRAFNKASQRRSSE